MGIKTYCNNGNNCNNNTNMKTTHGVHFKLNLKHFPIITRHLIWL